MYVQDIRTILIRPLQEKTGQEQLATFKELHSLPIKQDLKPKYICQDNAVPETA